MIEEDKIKRGSVFIADLNPTVGSEQYGRRPVVILSNDLNNKYSPTILVAPLTKILKKTKLPTHIIIRKNYFLKYDSLILLEQLRTIDKVRLVAYKGKVDFNTLEKINNGLIESEDIDFITYLKSLGIGGKDEERKRIY
ncbi:MAG: type II toxin-antitoxin system PemK/MazF family toxin, partial [Clostridia bacterium]|nr:type II toxin-antitoxin system PemK/MazF family toxin [Clostridia bacterium]